MRLKGLVPIRSFTNCCTEKIGIVRGITINILKILMSIPGFLWVRRCCFSNTWVTLGENDTDEIRFIIDVLFLITINNYFSCFLVLITHSFSLGNPFFNGHHIMNAAIQPRNRCFFRSV